MLENPSSAIDCICNDFLQSIFSVKLPPLDGRCCRRSVALLQRCMTLQVTLFHIKLLCRIEFHVLWHQSWPSWALPVREAAAQPTAWSVPLRVSDSKWLDFRHSDVTRLCDTAITGWYIIGLLTNTRSRLPGRCRVSQRTCLFRWPRICCVTWHLGVLTYCGPYFFITQSYTSS